jgi:putative cell wall-binding protein
MRTIPIAVVMIASLMATSTVTAAGAASSDVDVVILGGPNVVSSDVASHLASCTDGTVTRIAGGDRYATAAAVSRSAFESARIVYLAVGASYPEAVAAGPIAALRGAPVLLTRTDLLPAETRTEIQRLGATQVVILGGTGAVSSSVEDDHGATYDVIRIAGADRYSTVAAISASYFVPGGVSVAYVATGDLFPDALAAGPAAVASDGPILLTDPNDLSGPTAAELQRLAPARIVILGGTAAISSGVEQALRKFTSGSVSRLAGSNRFDTAAVISTTLPNGPATIYLATGDDFPDALAGVPLAGTNPLLLVTQQMVPGQTANRIAAITGKPCAPLVPTTSSGSPPSATILPLPTAATKSLQAGVLWSSDVETGNLSQWHNSPSVSGSGTAVASTENPHTGSYGLKLTANGLAGIRMKVQTLDSDPFNLPTDAYYSAWYFVPFTNMRDNIFQFKQADATKWDSQGNPTAQTRRMLSKISLEWDGAAYDVAYRTRIDQPSCGWRSGEADELARSDVNIPVGQWVHLEMRYVWNDQHQGRSTLWVDGVQVWDLNGICTQADNLVPKEQPRQWAVNHYLSAGGNDSSRTTWIFIDDAVISTSRIGP